MKWEQLLSNKHFIEPEQESELLCRNDYDTIICSTLFRRLQDKAQVFPLDEDDYVRTRLTHSLEVSAIGKKLGEYVFRELKARRADPWFETHTEKEFSDVLLCAGLVHDIGNPPFGHFGEYAIREWFQNHLQQLALGEKAVTEILNDWQLQDLYHFEGNAQSLRLLSKTPYLGTGNGFNLSYRVLGTILKYPISSMELETENPRGYKKMGYNYSERQLFQEMSAELGMEGCRHPLSYLLEAADDIAYRTSDLEDAMVKKVLTYPQMEEALGNYENLSELYQEERKKGSNKPELSAVQRWNQRLQSRMIKEAGNAFVSHYEALMQGTFAGDLFAGTVSGEIILAISKLSEQFIYTSSIKTRTELFGRRVIDSLLSQFLPAALVYDTEEPVSFIERRTMDTVSHFYRSMYHSEAKGKCGADRLYLRILMITDYISGMTDNYAKRLYRELFV